MPDRYQTTSSGYGAFFRASNKNTINSRVVLHGRRSSSSVIAAKPAAKPAAAQDCKACGRTPTAAGTVGAVHESWSGKALRSLAY